MRCRHFVAIKLKGGVQVFDIEGYEFQATKNPSTLNQNGGVDGLHKMGTSKKSSGNSYD